MPTRSARLPPPDTSLHDTGPDTEDLSRAARQLRLLEHWGLTPRSQLLEIGCGVGRLPYRLADYLDEHGSYTGFDLSEPAITWLNTHYAPTLPNFRFDLFDVRNARYRPRHGRPAHDLDFPYDDGAFDFACSFAVFMHMQLQEIANYVLELYRVLVPGATAVLTATAISRRDHDRDDLPVLGNRRFNQVGPGTYAKRPDQPTSGLAYDVDLLAAVMEQAGFEVIHFAEGTWRPDAAPEFSLVPDVGGDAFVIRRNQAPFDVDEHEERRRVTELVVALSLDDAVTRLTEVNRARPRPDVELGLVRLRYRAAHIRGVDRLRPGSHAPDRVAEEAVASGPVERFPQLERGDTALARGHLVRPGWTVIRGAIPADVAGSLADAARRALAGARAEGDRPHGEDPWFVPFTADGDPLGGAGRFWSLAQGRVWTTESPPLAFRLLEALQHAGIRALVADVLADRPVLPLMRNVVTVTDAEPTGAWWQETAVGSHAGVAVGLCLCLADGGRSPGFDLVPGRRPPLPHNVDPGAGPLGVDPGRVATSAGDTPVTHVSLGAGDLLLIEGSVLRRERREPGPGPVVSADLVAVAEGTAAPDAHESWW